MKVALSAVGSRGDVQPLFALARALRGRGHDVALAAPPDFAGWAAQEGVPFKPCGRDVQAWLSSVTVARISPLELMREFKGMMEADLAEQTAVLNDVAEGASVVVTAGMQLAGASVAEHRAVPSTYVHYSPWLIPSDRHPPMFLPLPWMPAPANRLLHAIFDVFMARVTLPPLNLARGKLGLPPLTRIYDMLPAHAVLAFDDVLAAAPADLDVQVVRKRLPLTGFEQVGALGFPDDAALPDDVTAFLEAGPPPIYVGFGSMPDREPQKTTAALVEAAERLGVRVVLASGWTAGDRGPLPASFHVLTAAPHARLFRRVAAVVHHGGAGTTATAMRAGVPQVVVPHFVDQHAWAAAVHKAGLGPRAFTKRRFTAARLQAALAVCLQDDAMKARATAVAAQLATTDPCGRMVDVLEAMAR